jgi:hypothetical protein
MRGRHGGGRARIRVDGKPHNILFQFDNCLLEAASQRSSTGGACRGQAALVLQAGGSKIPLHAPECDASGRPLPATVLPGEGNATAHQAASTPGSPPPAADRQAGRGIARVLEHSLRGRALISLARDYRIVWAQQ